MPTHLFVTVRYNLHIAGDIQGDRQTSFKEVYKLGCRLRPICGDVADI